MIQVEISYIKTLLSGALLMLALESSSKAQSLETIKNELEQDYYTSLSMRQQVRPIIRKYGYKSPQMDSLNQAIATFDSVALLRTVQIIEKHGWLGKHDTGSMANQTLFLTIQHARDKAIRQKYYPLLEMSANKGESNLFDMATMKDRMLVEDGKLQLYGTQYDIDGKYYPIADRKQLNKRRKQVGLKPIRLSKTR